MTVYTYGNAVLHDGVNTFIQQKPYNLVPFTQTLQKIARQEGMKKSGETVDARTIRVTIKIIGTSRADLETRISVLNTGLAMRQQPLRIYANDARYYIADYVGSDPTSDMMFLPDQPNSILATLTFVCQQPYAYAPTTTTSSTGTILLTAVSTGVYTFPPVLIAGGGNVLARPTIRVQQLVTGLAWTFIQVAQQSDGQTIKVTTGLPTSAGDFVDFFCDPVQSANGYTVQKNDNGTPLDFSGQFPQLDAGPTLWSVTVGAPSAPRGQVIWTWTARYLP